MRLVMLKFYVDEREFENYNKPQFRFTFIDF